MKDVFRDLFQSFKKASYKKKFLLSIFLLIYMLVLISVLIKVNYQVTTPGAITSTVSTTADPKDYWVIKIQEENLAGNINTVGIYNHKRISYFQYLISKLSPRVKISDYDPKTMLSEEEDVVRGVLQKDYSIIDALIVAYEAASLKDSSIHIEYKFQGLLVMAVMKHSESNLLPGDLIKSINGQSFKNIDEFRTILSSLTEGEFPMIVIREKEEVEISSKMVFLEEQGYKLGVELHEKIEIDKNLTKPAYIINPNLSSIGSSGGAMMALAVYNALTEGDLTKGKVIIGTINLDGSIGEIGGTAQKIATASMYGADIFIVGKENYDEAYATYIQMKDLFKPNFKLIQAKNFQEMITLLEALNED